MDSERQAALSNTVTNFRATLPTGGVKITGLSIDNTANTATTYLHIFGVPAADVTLGTTTPIFRFPFGAGVAALEPATENKFLASATTGLSAAVTTTATGTTAPATAVDVTIYFK